MDRPETQDVIPYQERPKKIDTNGIFLRHKKQDPKRRQVWKTAAKR